MSDLDSILEDGLVRSKDFDSVVWSHVCRDGNYVPYHLTRLVPFGIEHRWEDHCSLDVSSYVLLDYLSLD